MFLSSLFKNKDREVSVVSAIIVAAGQGSRMQTDIKKQYIEIAGKPILAYTLEAFQRCDYIDEIILVVGKDDIITAKDIAESYEITKLTKIIRGGKRRQDSVYNGLLEVCDECNYVAVHDGARPLINTIDIENVVKDAMKFGAAILGVRSKDTVKMVDENQTVISTPNREYIYSIQTPQVFNKDLLIKGYELSKENDATYTDDSSLMEAAGVKIKVTEGDYKNIKITTSEDLIFFQANIEFIDY